MLVRKHIVQFNISTYVQTGAWGAKVGIHPGRKMQAMTLHTKLVMVTWCQGALLNHLKLLHHRKILTCCAMARADGGLRGEQSFTVTCAGGERVSTLCTQKLVPVKCKTSSRHFVEYFQGWKRKFYSHTSKPFFMLLFLLIIVEKFTYFTPASSHQAPKAWQPGSHLDADLTTEVGLK